MAFHLILDAGATGAGLDELDAISTHMPGPSHD
jgi:hypothetical protein